MASQTVTEDSSCHYFAVCLVLSVENASRTTHRIDTNNSMKGMEEDCIGLTTSDGRWGDTPCQRNSFFYMCKIKDPEFVDADENEPTDELTDNCPRAITSPDNTTITPDKIDCYCSNQNGYEKVGNKCLKITEETDSWSKVQGLCEKDGGYLAVFDGNKDQYEIFRQWIQQKAERHDGHPRVWFGLREKNLTSVTRGGSYTSIAANFHQFFGYTKSTFNNFSTGLVAPGLRLQKQECLHQSVIVPVRGTDIRSGHPCSKST